MNNFDWDQYPDAPEQDDNNQLNDIRLSIGVPPMKTHEMFDWDQYPDAPEVKTENIPQDQESGLRKGIRYASQIPAGIAQAFTWPLGLIKNASSAYALDEMRRMELEGDQVNPKAYQQAIENVASYFPDQENAEAFLESKGIPVQAKTTGQKLLRLGGTAATLNPGSLSSKLGAGGISAGTSGLLREVGVPEEIADIASLLAYPTGKSLGKYAKNKISGNQSQSLASSIVGENLPASSYDTSEKLLKELTDIEAGEIAAKQAPKQKAPYPLNQPTQATNPLNKARVKEKGKDLGLRPIPQKGPHSLSDDVGKIISSQKFYNTTEGGKGIMNEVREIDQMAYRKVKDLYKISREANQSVENIHPKLVNEIEDRLSELTKIPQPSTPQAKMISTLKKLRKSLVELDEEGNIIGFKPISNQALIDQTQALKQIIDFDFAHGDANNIFRPLIEDIENSITGAARESGDQAAIKSWEAAKKGYKTWADTFNNDYIRPLRNVSNKDYSSQFKKLIDVDEVNVLSSVLNQTEKGRILDRGIKRELVDKHLGKYFDKPKAIDVKEFEKSLRELEAVLTKNEIQSIRNTFNQYKKSTSIRAKHITTEAEKQMAKYIGKDPEYIQSKFDTRSGIKELKEASTTEEAKKTFHTIARQRMRTILHEGNIEKNFTGNDLYKVLNNEKNAEIFRELIGDEATEAARLSAKEIGKNQMRIDKIKEGTKKVATIKFLTKILPLIF